MTPFDPITAAQEFARLQATIDKDQKRQAVLRGQLIHYVGDDQGDDAQQLYQTEHGVVQVCVPAFGEPIVRLVEVVPTPACDAAI